MSEQSVLQFFKNQEVMSGQLDQNVCEAAGLVGGSQGAGISTNQKCSNEKQPVTRPTHGHGECRLACLVPQMSCSN